MGNKLDIEALLRAGRKIEAIKERREQTGDGLREAKEYVEALAVRLGVAKPRTLAEDLRELAWRVGFLEKKSPLVPELLAACKAAVDWWHSKPSNTTREEPAWLEQARVIIRLSESVLRS